MNDRDRKLEKNVTRTVAIRALRKIRVLVDGDEKQAMLNRSRAALLLILLVALFAGLMFFMIKRSPADVVINAGLL